MGLGQVDGKILDKYTFIWALLYLQFVLYIMWEQISHILVINFNERAANQKLFWSGLADSFENVSKSSGDDSLQVLIVRLSHHRMCLAAASLPVGKDGTIVPGEHVLNQVICCFCIYCLLMRVLPEHIVESEGFYIIRFIRFCDWHLVIGFIHFYHVDTSPFFLLLVHWPDSDHDLNCFAHGKLEWLRNIKSYSNWVLIKLCITGQSASFPLQVGLSARNRIINDT